MKTSKTLLIAYLFFTIISTSCRKEKGIDDLPPETQIGANTFGCLVDGKVFIPSGSDGYSGTNIKANYQYIYPSPVGYSFVISAHDYNRTPSPFVVIGSDSLKLEEGLILKTGEFRGGAGGRYRIGSDPSNDFRSLKSLPGEIYIKKFDETNQIVSGTFWFDAINYQGKFVHVTNGRFDIKYTR